MAKRTAPLAAFDPATYILTLCEQGLTTLEMRDRAASDWPELAWTMDGIERLARQVTDRRPVARRYLESKSLDLARSVVQDGKPSDHVRALEGMRVLDTRDTGAAGLTIIVGAGAVQVNIGDARDE